MALPIIYQKSDAPFGFREPEGDGYKNLTQYENILWYITDAFGNRIQYSRETKEGYNTVVIKSDYLINVWMRKTHLATLKPGKLKLTVHVAISNSEVNDEVTTIFEDYIAELKQSAA